MLYKISNNDYAYSPIKGMNHGAFMDVFPIDNVVTENGQSITHNWIADGSEKDKTKNTVWQDLCIEEAVLSCYVCTADEGTMQADGMCMHEI